MYFGMPGQNFVYTGRSTVGGDAVESGYSATSVQNYDLDDVARWAVNTTTKNIDIDRGGSFGDYADADVVVLLGFSVSDFDAVANTCGLTSINVQQDDNSGFTSATNLLTSALTNGSPTDGPGAFVGPTVMLKLDTACSERYLRIVLTTSATVNIDIGCIWASAAIDTTDNDYGAKPEFDIVGIDRRIKTEQYGGGQSITDRNPTRRVALELTPTDRAWHLFNDAIEGRLSGYVDDPSNPWLIALDVANKTRETGRHHWAGLWTFDGNIANKLTSSFVGTLRAIRTGFVLRGWR